MHVHAHTYMTMYNSSTLSVQKVPVPKLQHKDGEDDDPTQDQDLDSLHGPKDHVNQGSHGGTPHEEPTDLIFEGNYFLEAGTHGGTPHGVPRKHIFTTSRSFSCLSSRGPKKELVRNETHEYSAEAFKEMEFKDNALKCKCTVINRTMDDGGLFNTWDRPRRTQDHDDVYVDAGPQMDSQGSGHGPTWTLGTGPQVFVIFTGINLCCTLAWLCHTVVTTQAVSLHHGPLTWNPGIRSRCGAETSRYGLSQTAISNPIVRLRFSFNS